MGQGQDERTFSPSSTTEVLRRRTVSLLGVGLGCGGLVHGERSAHRDSITREAYFIRGSQAIHVGTLRTFEGKASRQTERVTFF